MQMPSKSPLKPDNISFNCCLFILCTKLIPSFPSLKPPPPIRRKLNPINQIFIPNRHPSDKLTFFKEKRFALDLGGQVEAEVMTYLEDKF